MPRTVGGRDGSADVILVQRLAAVVLLLSLGVHGIAEEPQPVQHSQQEKALSPHPIVPVRGDDPTKGNLGFIHAFVASFSVIIVSELGDKTFFIAAIMAMRYNRLTVLVGAMLALGVMTCLSVLFGYATTVIPRIYTYYVSTALFAIFGIRMLREGLKMSPDEGQEELEEVQAEIKKKDEELQRAKLANGVADVEAGSGNAQPQRKWQSFISPIFLQALTLTFVAEWGDRSQLTTIILAAREVLCGVQPSKKKSSFRFSFRLSTRSGRSFNPRALFPAFIAVLSKYHANKTSNWIIQFSHFDFKNRKIQFICIFFLPFFGFKTKSEKPKNDLIVFSDFVLNRNIQRTNHTRIVKWHYVLLF
uniref:GDT1 family protein n=1 Tax=Gadus morhua TaxID=8049 RepID=A0A8C4ZTQ4_GADMO